MPSDVLLHCINKFNYSFPGLILFGNTVFSAELLARFNKLVLFWTAWSLVRFNRSIPGHILYSDMNHRTLGLLCQYVLTTELLTKIYHLAVTTELLATLNQLVFTTELLATLNQLVFTTELLATLNQLVFTTELLAILNQLAFTTGRSQDKTASIQWFTTEHCRTKSASIHHWALSRLNQL